MCTCMVMGKENGFFGRTLDYECRFGESVAVTPRNYPFSFKNSPAVRTRYAMIGMATVMKDYPLYAEAVNEKGVAMAGLNFPGSAVYFEPADGKLNLASYELLPWFLGQYETAAQIRECLTGLVITNAAFSESVPPARLHWMICDKEECFVLEQTQEGLRWYDNPVGVMTNNPPFPYQMMNLRNYLNLTPNDPVNRFSDRLSLLPYGRGMGAIGLPGDCSPESRFVRAAFNKLHSEYADDAVSSVTQFFHVLDSVSLVRGATITEDGKPDVTNYSCCMDTVTGTYYYKTYNNNQITAVKMTEKEKNAARLTNIPLVEEQQIRYVN